MADELDPKLKRAFAADPAGEGGTAAHDAEAFLVRVRVRIGAAERQRRVIRGVLLAALTLGVLAVTPWVVQMSLLLAQALVSPWGAFAAIALSMLASLRAVRSLAG